MTDIRISEMPPITAFTGTEIAEVVQSGVNSKHTITELKTFCNTGVPATISCVFDGGTTTIEADSQVEVYIPYNFTITGVYLLANAVGSIVIDVWAADYATYPPSNANSITASATPTLSSANKMHDITLTGWTTAITSGTVVKFNVDSCTGINRVTLTLEGTKT